MIKSVTSKLSTNIVNQRTTQPKLKGKALKAVEKKELRGSQSFCFCRVSFAFASLAASVCCKCGPFANEVLLLHTLSLELFVFAVDHFLLPCLLLLSCIFCFSCGTCRSPIAHYKNSPLVELDTGSKLCKNAHF